MDDAAGIRFALIEAELAGIFAAMADGERVEAIRVCQPPAVRQALRVRDYDCFLCLAFERWAHFASPEWTVVNAGDTGTVLSELLAYAADHLSYHPDAVAAEAYPGSTHQRVSMCRLIDSWVHDGCAPRD